MTVLSRKLTDEWEVSCTNLIVGWVLFRCWMNSSSECSPWGQSMKMSSM